MIIQHLKQEYVKEGNGERLKTLESYKDKSEKIKKVNIKETFGFFRELKDGT